ncbi:unnamed protein product [Rotaria sordida]|uniref:Uncharacterized protein n=1 Tax=Rotaria sordida TaxID=392033 RepID=A0A815CEW6_9BILA|nr:unnamed protein product [Rotaria sordida]CAF1286291.1 unnamed protein product [Rotaria sordida]CAF1321757.1 unnamed protein product [Rotaria sordida]
MKANNDQHKKHIDQYFATNTINHLKTLAGSFCNDAVFFLITLPDHNFVLAPVYASCVINEKKEVSYSGPTYVTIRSGKHDSSTAETNHHNFSLLFDSKEFEPVMKINGQCKPIVIICVDGGPDENPRYAKTLVGGVNLFKKYQLDCLFVVSNCPGRSAFNMVERRMAPLSNQLAED